MTFPFYTNPEQVQREKAEYARRGISRGRSVVAIEYTDGVLFVADNPSATLYKLSEIYDHIAFAAVGKYSEFEQLRVQGIRLADVRGYQYAREDVTGRSLATAYANALGGAFTELAKPMEVEMLIAEVTDDGVDVYHIIYDGSITDEQGSVAIGGSAEAINARLTESYRPGLDLPGALRLAQRALLGPEQDAAPAGRLEVAGLDRTRGRRKFFRLPQEDVTRHLGTPPAVSDGDAAP